jgi:hypothetical protein
MGIKTVNPYLPRSESGDFAFEVRVSASLSPYICHFYCFIDKKSLFSTAKPGNPVKMKGGPLPRVVSVLFVASFIVIFATFILSTIHLKSLNLWITPFNSFITAIYHITLVILSRRRINSTPASNAEVVDDLDQSDSIYLPPPSSASQSWQSKIPTIREQYVQIGGPVYPSLITGGLNCVIVFLLGLIWAGTSWLPLSLVANGEVQALTRWPIIIVLEGAVGYLESILLFSLCATFVHHRMPQFRSVESFHMEN